MRCSFAAWQARAILGAQAMTGTSHFGPTGTIMGDSMRLLRASSVTGENGSDHAGGNGDQYVVAVDVQPAVVAWWGGQLACAPVGDPIAVAAVHRFDDTTTLPLLVRYRHASLRTETGVMVGLMAAIAIVALVALPLRAALLALLLLALLVALLRAALLDLLALLRVPLVTATVIQWVATWLGEAGQRHAEHESSAEHRQVLFHQSCSYLNSRCRMRLAYPIPRSGRLVRSTIQTVCFDK